MSDSMGGRPPAGVCPILATPFTADGEVDVPSFRREIDVLIAGGCQGVTLFGIAGEYYKLTDAERDRMAQVLMDQARGRVTTIISVTDHATEVAVRSAQRFAALQPDCLMLLPPFFLKPNAAATDRHIRAVAAAVPQTPIMVQYAPEQTGVGIAPDVFAAIARDCPNVCHFKIECRPPGPYISRLLDLTDRKVAVHVGNAGFQMIESFARGAVGVMPGASMFDVYLAIVEALRAGDEQRAFEVHGRLLAVLNQIRQDVEMIIAFEKHILQRRGIIASDYCRQPSHRPDVVERRMFECVYSQIEPLLMIRD